MTAYKTPDGWALRLSANELQSLQDTLDAALQCMVQPAAVLQRPAVAEGWRLFRRDVALDLLRDAWARWLEDNGDALIGHGEEAAELWISLAPCHLKGFVRLEDL